MMDWLLRVTKEHKEKFGVEPYCLGMFWSNQEELITRIEKAIKDDKPYDERDLLSKEDLEKLSKGELVF
jgi:hypothetical protein